MPSRKAHKNSHHGCLRCKSKRVKCDQQQPRCQRCERHNADCVYRHLMTSYDPWQRGIVPIQPRGEVNQAFGTTPVTQSPMYSVSPQSALQPTILNQDFPDIPWEDRYLLHHFVNNLAGNHLAPILDSAIRPLLTQTIVQTVNTHAFVRHAVISYAALHLSSIASMNPNPSNHLVTALHHKDAAIASFRPFLSDQLQPHQCEAAVAASVVLVACTFAIPIADHTDSTGVDRIELLSQVTGLFQGLVALLRLGRGATTALEAMKTANVGKAVGISHRVEVAWPEAGTSLEKVLRVIHELDESDDASQIRKTVLFRAASKLHTLVQRVAQDESSYVAVCMWLGRVDVEFVDMIRNRDPLALVIMAHYAASRKGVTSWWANMWPHEALSAIVKALEGQHADLLDWCLESIQASPSGNTHGRITPDYAAPIVAVQ